MGSSSVRGWTSLVGLLVMVAPPSMAVDGVIEINHAAALAGGVSPGDAAGSHRDSARCLGSERPLAPRCVNIGSVAAAGREGLRLR